MKKLGFSLVEMLIVLTIVGILTALLVPVFITAKAQSKVARSMSNMHQMAVAMSIYREAHSGSESLCGLGLPPRLMSLAAETNLPKELFHTGGSNFGFPGWDVYTFMLPSSPQDTLKPKWDAYYSEVGENAVCILDETQNPGQISKTMPFHSMRVLALRLNGSVQIKRIRGGGTGPYSHWR